MAIKMKGKNYTVIDDFLPKEEFEEIKYNVCNSESFAWSFVKHVSTNIETEEVIEENPYYEYPKRNFR